MLRPIVAPDKPVTGPVNRALRTRPLGKNEVSTLKSSIAGISKVARASETHIQAKTVWPARTQWESLREFVPRTAQAQQCGLLRGVPNLSNSGSCLVQFIIYELCVCLWESHVVWCCPRGGLKVLHPHTSGSNHGLNLVRTATSP